MAAASALVMGQQPALHMVQGERTSSGYAGSASMMHLRRTGVAAVALRPTFRQTARGSHSRRSFVAAAVGGEAGCVLILCLSCVVLVSLRSVGIRHCLISAGGLSWLN